ncbi:MAG: response regulator transcription factor [Syntrophobacteraceae bacterium]|jgi:DNA-binding NarL/FixJ family response regulator
MNIFLADDHPLFRIGLRIALDQEEEMRVIGEASDGFSAVEKIQSNPPDLSLIDVDMPGISGIRAIRILRKAMPEMKILVLSTYDDEKYIHEAMLAGADGYLLKCVEVADLVKVIRSVCEGRQIVSPFLVNLAIEGGTGDGSEEPTGSIVLTQREKEILKAIIDGLSNKEISDSLFISIETVKSHVKSIYQKLHVRNRVEAAQVAMRKRLFPLH